MLLLQGLKSLQKVSWEDLRPGWIVLGGVQINGSLPPELLGYPVLTQQLLNSIRQKYHFFSSKTVLAAEADRASGYNPSLALIQAQERVTSINKIRDEVFNEKNELLKKFSLKLEPNMDLSSSDAAEVEFLHRDRLNSVDVIYNPQYGEMPTAFARPDARIAFSDIITGSLYSKFNFPRMSPLELHIGVDFSYSMTNMKKLDFVISAVHSLYRFVMETMPHVKINIYAFSDVCEKVSYPLGGREVPKKGTSYDSLFRKVLKYYNNDSVNKLILFTDGLPSDREAALGRTAVLKKKKLDFTQIIFSMNDEERNIVESDAPSLDGYSLDDNAEKFTRVLSDAEFEEKKRETYNEYSSFAEAMNGNQIIVKIYDFLKLISIEVFDRYTGFLSLSEDG